VVTSRRNENAAFLRVERRNRILIGLAIVLGAALTFWFGVRHPADPLRNPAVARTCESLYAGAASPAETTMVDVQAPMLDPSVPETKVSCGELRRADRLRQ
jgi:hypothetical protein